MLFNIDIFASVCGLLVCFSCQIYSIGKSNCNYFLYNDILKFYRSKILKNMHTIIVLNN